MPPSGALVDIVTMSSVPDQERKLPRDLWLKARKRARIFSKPGNAGFANPRNRHGLEALQIFLLTNALIGLIIRPHQELCCVDGQNCGAEAFIILNKTKRWTGARGCLFSR
jgi:hypothetical protein